MTQEQASKLASEVRTFLFQRKEGWYMVDLPRDTVEDNALCNPGTIRVVDAITLEIVWEAQEP